MCVFRFSNVQLFQAPLFTGFSRQGYLSGLPGPPPGDLPNSGIKPVSFTSPVLVDEFFTTSATWEGFTISIFLFFPKCHIINDIQYVTFFPVFSPGKSHGQRSLVGYSPWGHKQSDKTQQLNNNSSYGWHVCIPA